MDSVLSSERKREKERKRERVRQKSCRQHFLPSNPHYRSISSDFLPFLFFPVFSFSLLCSYSFIFSSFPFPRANSQNKEEEEEDCVMNRADLARPIV